MGDPPPPPPKRVVLFVFLQASSRIASSAHIWIGFPHDPSQEIQERLGLEQEANSSIRGPRDWAVEVTEKVVFSYRTWCLTHDLFGIRETGGVKKPGFRRSETDGFFRVKFSDLFRQSTAFSRDVGHLIRIRRGAAQRTNLM